MAESYYARTIYDKTSLGDDTFIFDFDYVSARDVHVSIDGNEIYDFEFLDSHTIKLHNPLKGGEVLTVFRSTFLETRTVDFVNAAELTEKDLDDSADQVFYAMQEAYDLARDSIKPQPDGSFSMSNRPLKEVADPQNPTDAANRNYVDAQYGINSALRNGITEDKAASAASASKAAGHEAEAGKHALTAATQAGVATDKASFAGEAKLAAESARDLVLEKTEVVLGAKEHVQINKDLVFSRVADAETYKIQAGESKDQALNHELKAKKWAEEAPNVQVEPSRYSAKHYAVRAEQWAEKALDSPVEPGVYSAKHYAEKTKGLNNISQQLHDIVVTEATRVEQDALTASVARNQAVQAANNAALSEANADNYAFDADQARQTAQEHSASAKSSMDAAKASEEASALSETAAKDSETAAAASQLAAKNSETAAKASQTAAKESETNAKASQTAAKTSETNAKASETAAATSELSAAESASIASTKADATALDAINSARSASAAKTSETNAEASALEASSSETEAGKSQAAAKASEQAAANSETAAETSASKAKTSETNAKASELSSASSKSAAKTSETNAKASELAAASSASASKTSETKAKTSETNAKTSETNAAASEAKAKEWAVKPEGQEVEPGLYSSRHYAEQAKAAVNGARIYVSEYNASTGKLPIANPQIADKGKYWVISAPGTLPQVGVVDIGTEIIVNDDLSYGVVPVPQVYLRRGENLSDVTNTVTARNNLGLGNAALKTVGTASGSLPTTGQADARYLKKTEQHDHDIGDVTGLRAELDGKADTVHGHDISEVTGLQAALDDKSDTTHGHTIVKITGLQEALDGKSDSGHGHKIAAITGLQAALNSKLGATSNAVSASKLAAAFGLTLGGDLTGTVNIDGSESVTLTATVKDDSHNHVIANVDGLQVALDGKSAVGHGHAIADVSGLQEALDGKSDAGHTHVIGNVTGLQAALNGKLSAGANAVSASKWATARTLTLGGDLSGSVGVDGTKNVTLTASVKDDSHAHTISTVTGLQEALDGKLNAGATAVAAAKLATARTISLAGDATGSTSFNGVSNRTLTVTVKDNSHNHTIGNVTGLQEALAGKEAKGTAYSKAQSDNRYLSSGVTSSPDWNNATGNGVIYQSLDGLNAPISGWLQGTFFAHNDTHGTQIVWTFTLDKVRKFTRNMKASAWTPWVEEYNTGNFNPNSKANTTGTYAIRATATTKADVGLSKVRNVEAYAKTETYSKEQVDVAVANAINASMPKGIISIWSGAVVDIPTGWALCDGTNGTPDLRDKFIVGAGGAYAVGDTGGSADAVIVEHSHSASTSSSGSHSHSGTTDAAGSHTHSYATYYRSSSSAIAGRFSSYRTDAPASTGHRGSIGYGGEHAHSFSTNTTGSHTHTVTVTKAGESGAGKNLPPYYALAFIMKL